ncbi:hypothetical protein HII31_06540 [Pseudocercospora fuligena]|uniref:Uncharacterized protein n=1 Tax=Pseudocercospora fuligena TaxID=685502 RepID=A0A8H6RJH5_9PEZI|nr:hypothetical protein HII31_06540 [Pseudocercospora fuligena]
MDTPVGAGLHSDHHALQRVARALSQGVEASCITCQKEHRFDIQINTTGNPSPFQWSVQLDQSAVPGELESSASSCQFHGLKLTTPSFRTTAIYSTSSEDDGHIHQLDYSGMIKAVLQHAHKTIVSLPSDRAPHHWLYAPANGPMEVRIGNDGLGFLDSTYGKVEELTKLCSRQIDVLHMGRSHIEGRDTENVASWSSATIDFHQAPSTLDSAQALVWIDFCLSTVQSCADPELDLDLSTKGQFASPTFSAFDMLQALGTSATTHRFYDSPIANAQTRCQEAIANAMLAMSSGSKIAELALSLANQELKSTNSDAILANVKVKLLNGTYGKFSDPYLKMALLSLNTNM